jgi:hypothetical protein
MLDSRLALQAGEVSGYGSDASRLARMFDRGYGFAGALAGHRALTGCVPQARSPGHVA